ncbi:MAG: molybdopterin oxidoreductase family protein, partial [Myxococcales bacterium]|nr:molybdopterin oxidoreductase family protein [Myxococcales bacterium]
IGRRELRTNNSWAHNLPSLVSGPRRCVLFMHPVDATARDVETDDSVVVASRVGSVEVPVHVTDEVMPGVVSLPHGYGHAVEGVRMKVAKEHAGVSVNDLTDPEPMDPLSGTAVLNGVPVTVRAVHAEAVA